MLHTSIELYQSDHIRGTVLLDARSEEDEKSRQRNASMQTDTVVT